MTDNLAVQFTDDAKLNVELSAGPFYFAWADAQEAFDVQTHAVFSDDIFDVRIEHNEGDFALMVMQIRNPRVGLLSPGRKLWGWLSWYSGTEIVPLFYGRLLGLPEQIQNDIVELQFVARPYDYATQKEAVADTMRVLPHFDPIWFDEEGRSDPDIVLETQSALWHIDRVTHEVTASDIITGEDGTINLTDNDALEGSISVTYQESPVSRVDVTGLVAWDQKAYGGIDFTNYLYRKFLEAGSGNGFTLQTYTGSGFAEDWPKVGATFQGGWAVRSSSINRVDSNGSARELLSPFSGRASESGVSVRFALWYNEGGYTAQMFFPRQAFTGSLVLGYDANRSRTEGVSFSLISDIQPIVTDPGGEEVIVLDLQSSAITEFLDDGGATQPMGDSRRRSYFTLERGQRSIEFLILMARAQLLARARAVDIELQLGFAQAVGLELSCRKNLVLTYDKLPGGIAGGKIKHYSLTANTENGEFLATIRIGCVVGRGNAITPVQGDPLYVNDGYVEQGYQQYENVLAVPAVGDIGYGPIDGNDVVDDGINFLGELRPEDMVLSFNIVNPADSQEVQMINRSHLLPPGFPSRPAGTDQKELMKHLNDIPTRVSMELRSLNNGPFQNVHPIFVTELMVPRGIDLEDGGAS